MLTLQNMYVHESCISLFPLVLQYTFSKMTIKEHKLTAISRNLLFWKENTTDVPPVSSWKTSSLSTKCAIVQPGQSIGVFSLNCSSNPYDVISNVMYSVQTLPASKKSGPTIEPNQQMTSKSSSGFSLVGFPAKSFAHCDRYDIHSVSLFFFKFKRRIIIIIIILNITAAIRSFQGG